VVEKMALPNYLTEDWLWVLGSVLVYALAGNLSWYYRLPRPGRLGRWVAILRDNPYAAAAAAGLRLLYYIGVPYGALIWRRVVLPSRLGLVGRNQLQSVLLGWTVTEWLEGLGWALGLGLAALLLLAWDGRVAVRAVLRLPGTDLFPAPGIPFSRLPWWGQAQEVVYREVHWAFYRAVPLLALGDYSGVFLGFLLVCLEWALHPGWRAGLGDPRRVWGLLWEGGLAWSMALVFLFTRNLWLMIPVHWAVAWGSSRLIAAATPSAGHGETVHH